MQETQGAFWPIIARIAILFLIGSLTGDTPKNKSIKSITRFGWYGKYQPKIKEYNFEKYHKK